MSRVLIPMETPRADPKHPDRIVIKGVRDRVGMHPSTIYAEIKAGRWTRKGGANGDVAPSESRDPHAVLTPLLTSEAVPRTPARA